MQATGGAKCTDSGRVLEASFPRVAVELPLPRGLGFSFPGTWHPTVPTGILARCIRAVGAWAWVCKNSSSLISFIYWWDGELPLRSWPGAVSQQTPIYRGRGRDRGGRVGLVKGGGATTSRDTGDSISCEIIQDEKQFRPFRRPVRSIATISCILLGFCP